MVKTKKSRTLEPLPEQFYTSSDVARISGVSLRQLQWWDERNVVSPRQNGHRRVYLAGEVVEVSVIAALRRKGFSLQKIRRVLRFMQKEMGKRISDAVANDSEVHLLTDGKSIYLEESPDRVVDLLKDAKQPMFLVCVTDQLRRFQLATKKPMKSETAPSERRARLG
ncbi:MAG: transcriptional regulator, MerR family [Bryobacterales bacterium]|nr:transcriptional regulator, MerR family [Bryobacterales bacterium]